MPWSQFSGDPASEYYLIHCTDEEAKAQGPCMPGSGKHSQKMAELGPNPSLSGLQSPGSSQVNHTRRVPRQQCQSPHCHMGQKIFPCPNG